MGIIDSIVKGAAGSIVDGIGNALDKTITNDEERLAKKNELAQIVVPAVEKALEQQKEVLVVELSGSPLQRNWRPIVMLAFAFIVVYRYFIAPVFHLELVEMPEKFWDLLEIGIGGYVIGRSVEKIAAPFIKNPDLSLLRRKDRAKAGENNTNRE